MMHNIHLYIFDQTFGLISRRGTTKIWNAAMFSITIEPVMVGTDQSHLSIIPLIFSSLNQFINRHFELIWGFLHNVRHAASLVWLAMVCAMQYRVSLQHASHDWDGSPAWLGCSLCALLQAPQEDSVSTEFLGTRGPLTLFPSHSLPLSRPASAL